MVNASKYSESTVRRIVANSPKKLRKSLSPAKASRASTYNFANQPGVQQGSVPVRALLSMTRNRSPTIPEVMSPGESSGNEDSDDDSESEENVSVFDKTAEVNENGRELERDQEIFEQWLVNSIAMR